MHVRIDERVGGYEHRYDRDEVHAGLMQFVAHSRCRGGFIQDTCSHWSAVHFAPDGTPPIFRAGFPDGVLDSAGAVIPQAQVAMRVATRSSSLARQLLSHERLMLAEHPASQGADSLQPSRGLEDHSTLYDTSPWKAVIVEFKLISVYTDLGMSGHDKRKTTHFLADSVLAPPLREAVGTLRVPKGWVSKTPPLQGRDASGVYRTAGSETYPPLLAQRLAGAWCAALVALEALKAAVEGGGEGTAYSSDAAADDTATDNAAQATDHDSDRVLDITRSDSDEDSPVANQVDSPIISPVEPNRKAAPRAYSFPIGARVEVYWHKNYKWYAGRVVQHGTSRTVIKGTRCSVPDVQVHYDDGETLTHMLHANSIRPEGDVTPTTLLPIMGEDEAIKMFGIDDDFEDEKEKMMFPTLSLILSDRSEVSEEQASSEHLDMASALDQAGAALLTLDKKGVMESIETEIKASLETSEVEEVNLNTGTHAHAGECLVITDLQFDIEESLILNKSTLFLVSNEGKLLMARTLDTAHAKHWHTPGNEREYNASPQRDLWRTAKELKWDKYLALNMFEWVPVSSIDTKTNRIYATLWVYKIKFEEGLKFSKLNPRWCLKGGTMDRDKFKAHAETLRISSYRIILACKGGYWHAFCEFLLDCSDAFQSTRTDDVPLEEQTPLYCWPGPGFEQRTESGERMACKVKVAMQGRIDATLLFNTKLFQLLVLKTGMTRLTWDRQVAIYHVGPLTMSAASLSQILLSVKSAKDTGPQEPPVGYAILGWHVDDALGLACSVGWNRDIKSNRVIQYIKGTIEVLYATTLTGWHGNKSLGYTLTLDEENERVTMSARDTLEQLGTDLLKGMVRISPRHVVTNEFYDIPAGELPAHSDPEKTRVLADMALCRHALGTFIWTNQAHIEAMPGNNELCSNMQFPTSLTLKCLRFQLMHLLAFSKGIAFGKKGNFGLEQPEGVNLKDPYGSDKFMFAHYFADANLRARSTTGGIGMLGGGCILPICQRQHLSAPGSHTVEVVGAGTNFSLLVPVNGVLQELHIRQGVPTPFYLDSSTTVFVATSDTAIRKSIWLIRRVAVLEDGVTHGEIGPLHISERDMAADPFTKYLTYGVWSRHMHYILNKMGPMPEYPQRSKQSS